MQKAAFECIYKAASQGDFPLTRKDDASSPAIPFRVKARFFMVRKDIATYLGHLYNMGLGVEKNMAEAFFWYRKAAENGNSKGQFALGRFYEEGITVKKDMELALQWYQKAAKQGDELAKKKIKEIQSL